jgi:prepilin-type N-terminal cleavage/methylation domain-containing protein
MFNGQDSRQRRAGFTLIELLVVIAIIGILASMLLPVLSAAKIRAKRSQCLSNLHQWIVAFNSYAGDFNDNLPLGWGDSNGQWMVALQPYNSNPAIDFCPTATTTRDTLPNMWENPAPANTAWGTMGSGAYPVISPWGRAGMAGSYGINGWMFDPADNGAGAEYWRKLVNTASVGGGNVPVFGDCIWDGTQPTPQDQPPQVPNEEEGNGGMSDFCMLRHPDSRYPINMAFADNSVRIVGMKQLWALKWSPDFDTTYAASQPQARFWPKWMNGYQ